MPNNKDGGESCSTDSTNDRRDVEFEIVGGSPGLGTAGQSNGAGTKSKQEEDDIPTAGGREGNFSDKDRDNESQWSPGSSQPSER